ncbi:MAG TPA: TonB-dependent receptor [Pyrinomonadaceae bacterium]|nr:TonB-dependent receptor [Pyrinomonadaceae bacterium]
MNKFFPRTRAGRGLALLAALVLASISALAQSTTGNLQGIVFDQNKAAVAGATVTVTNTETGVTRETTTNAEGFYRVTNMIPGERYKIEVRAEGFAPTVIEPVRVLLGTENNSDIVLNLSQVGADVVVTTDQQLIESTQNQLSANYNNEQLTELPINGLVDNIALLVPGIITPNDTDFTNGVGLSANGNRGRSNNFQIDGQDNNDLYIGGPATFISNSEAVGELQVVTNNFSAEFGRNAGAQVNIITRPGTNEFHGVLFEHHQNSALDARNNQQKLAASTFDFLVSNGFDQFSGLASREGIDPYRQNRFGGALGGPIKKNKAFFFVTYEGTYLRGEQQVNNLGSATLTPTLESIQFLSARFPNAATAQLARTGLGGGPAAVQYGSLLIAPPSLDTDGDGVPDTFQFGPGNPFGQPVTPGFLAPLAVTNDALGNRRVIFGGEAVRVVPLISTNHQLITRVDYNLTDKDQITGRYIFNDSDNPNVIDRILNGRPISVPSRSHNIGLTYTRTINASWVNQARFNYSTSDVEFGGRDNLQDFPPNVNFTGSPQDLFFNFGLDFGTSTVFPQARVVTVWQVQDTVSATVGNHALKFGADIIHNFQDNFFLPTFRGSFNFTGSTTNPAVTGFVPANTFFDFGSTGLNGPSREGELATSFENFLLGRPRDIDFALGDPQKDIVQNNYFFFIQDDWRIRPNLTLNLGLRYELTSQPLNPLIEDLNARESDPATALFDPAFPLSSRTLAKLPVDKNNFAPRVGFAWSPNIRFLGDRFTEGRTVIRAGFGIAYDPGFFNIVDNVVTGAPFAGAGRIRQVPGAAGSLPFPFQPTSRADLSLTPGTAGGNPLLFDNTRVSPNFYNPYTLSFNFGVQQEVFRNTVVEARYVSSRIVGQFQAYNGNPQLNFLNALGVAATGNAGAFTDGVLAGSNPGTNGNGRLIPGQGFTFIFTNGATSTYHGLQTRFDTRIGNDLTLTANYSLSKTIDNSSEVFSTVAGGQSISLSQDPFDVTDGERGLSAFHQKHNFAGSFLYELPFFREQRGLIGKLLGGYQVNGIVRLGSGRPYTPVQLNGFFDPRFPTLRPYNGNPEAPDTTIAFGSFANLVNFGDGSVPEGMFIIYDTANAGSQGRIVTGAEAQQQARLIYNDSGLPAALGSTAFIPFLEAFDLFKTPYGIGRNTFTGEPFYRVDLSLFKTLRLTEGTRLELRAEAFNVFNHRNFGVPNPVTESAFNGFTVGTYNNPGANTGSSRSMQLGFRFIF